MYVATLIANSNNKNLSVLILKQVVYDLGGTQYNILDDNIAIDIPLESEPINFEIVWKKLQKLKIDIVLQSIKNRRKKILLADMDSTIIEQECIDELADEAGVGERVAEITKRAMNGELDFEEALVERVKLLKGLSSEIIASVLKKRITLMPGAESLIKTMKSNGSYCALVSGGFTDFTDSISKRLNYSYDDVIAVGDGANDLGMLTKAGMGVALHAKPIVATQCKARLNFANLEGLLYLQGYSKQEIL
jgi:phosphoserine phosphatase